VVTVSWTPRSWVRVAAALFGLLFLLASPSRADSPEEIFERGNRAYDEGSFDDAVTAYDTLLRYQIEDARVEFNLGNAEFRRGNLGRAILHYERARRMEPTDRDIVGNLNYARSLRLDRVPAPERPVVVGWVVGWQDRVGPDRHAWALVVLVWCACGLLAWSLSSPERWSARYAWVLAALVVVSALVGTSWYATHERIEGHQVAVVLDELAEILAGPGENNATLATVHEGLDVEVWGERDEWIQVRLPNGVSGWVARGAVEVV